MALGGKSWTPKMLETSSITPKDDFISHIAIISVHAGLTDRQKIDRHKAHIKTIRPQSERMAKSIEDAHHQTEEYTPKSWLSCDRDLTNKKINKINKSLVAVWHGTKIRSTVPRLL